MSAMAPLACVGQPLSWLTLERHALAELQGAAASTATEHLASCAACSAALGTITGAAPRSLPALPPLPPPIDVSRADDLSQARARRRRSLAIGASIFVAAAAALLLVILRPRDVVQTGGELSTRVRVKGAGVVAMTLVRERDGAVAFDPLDVRDSDRWKVQLTCAPGGRATVEVVVYQPGEPAAVALSAQPFACGNDVVIPGAFRITGGAATICARLAADALPPLPAMPSSQMACRRLAP